MGGPIPENCPQIYTRAPWQVHTHTHAPTCTPHSKNKKLPVAQRCFLGIYLRTKGRLNLVTEQAYPPMGELDDYTCPYVLAEELRSLKGASQQGGGAAWVRAWGSCSINMMIVIIYDSCLLIGASCTLGTLLKILNSSFPQHLDIIIYAILPEEINLRQLRNSHVISKWQSWDLNPHLLCCGSSIIEPCPCQHSGLCSPLSRSGVIQGCL